MNSIKTIFVLGLLYFTFTNIAHSQFSIKDDSKIIEQVKKDVWIPFLEAYRDLDIDKMLSIQDPEITRVSIDKNKVEEAQDYFKGLMIFFGSIKTAGYKMNIRFSIVSSAVSENKVYQTGYYTVGLQAKGAADFKPTGYSSFTVLLTKKADEKWKISLDADTKSKLTEAEFLASGVLYQL